MAESKPFLFVHGACHGAWCWERVLDLLRVAGRDAYAIDLPGHGARAAEAAGARLPDYTRAVVGFIEELDLRGVVLVGHSMGGIVLQTAAEQAAERLAHLVFLAAYVLQDGESLMGLSRPETQRQWAELAAASANQTVTLPTELPIVRWMNRCERADLAWALPRLTPQPWLPVSEPVTLRRFPDVGLPMTYLVCSDDRGLTPERCRRYAARLPHARLRTLDGDHDIMISNPQALAAALLELG
ncbi:MAG: alpha/beta hydrolase [Candidatus Tectomicrobia bacterium]|nr:alpha/beta hydrolase [Candidatus Tectomicrobia bacterium]